MVALTISTFVFAGVGSAYLFLGRSLSRLTNSQQLEQSSRRAFYQFNQDVSRSSGISALGNSSVTLTTPTANETIIYSYSDGNLTRTQDISSDALAAEVTILLKNITAFDLNYYNKAGNSITTPLGVKSVEFSFTLGTGVAASSNTSAITRGTSSYTSASGLASSGTAVTYRGISPRAILRNSSVLQ